MINPPGLLEAGRVQIAISLALMLSLSPAYAQPRDAGRVQAGEDLARWRELQRDAPPSVDALVDFLEDFPSSPLAELAYRRLVETDAELPSDFRVNLGRVSASYSQHQQALERQPAGVVVATLDVRAVATSEPPAATLRGWVSPAPRLELGVGVAALPTVYVGVGGRLGPVSISARGLFDEEHAGLGAALRYDPWRYWRLSPFVEAVWAGPALAAGGCLGLSHTLPTGLSIDLAGGTQWRVADADLETLLRIGVAQSF